MIGTQNYLAPEVMGLVEADSSDGGFSYTSAVDIWALGMIVYQLVTNRLVFARPRDLVRYVQGQGIIPMQREEELSEGCFSFIQLLLARNPQERPTATEIAKLPWLKDFVTPLPGVAGASRYYSPIRYMSSRELITPFIKHSG